MQRVWWHMSVRAHCGTLCVRFLYGRSDKPSDGDDSHFEDYIVWPVGLDSGAHVFVVPTGNNGAAVVSQLRHHSMNEPRE